MINYLYFYPITTSSRYAAIFAIALIAVLPLPTYAVQSLPGEITGKLLNYKNNTAVSLHTIYIADLSILSDSNTRLTTPAQPKFVASSTISTACEKPKLPYKSYTCTNLQGEFNLPVQTLTSGPYHLAIVGQRGTVKIKSTSSKINVGNIRFNAAMPQSNKIAIISLFTHSSSDKLNSGGHKVNTSLHKVVSYQFDSEILSGYGVEITNSNIEYYPTLSIDADGNSILDVNRFTTVLVKGSWQEVSAQHGPETIERMLKFVEQGGTLLIKDNKKYSNLTSEDDLYI